MRSLIRSTGLALLLVGLTGLAACKRGSGEAEEAPIVVEQGEPIQLGESPTTAEEVQVVKEPQPRVVTRTVIRERPAPTRTAPREEAPARVSTIPGGTSIPVTLLHQIDSEHNQVGETWTARVSRDVVVGGQVVIPGGATVTGVVTAMDEGDPDGRGYITLDARSVETASGTRSIAAAPVSVGHSYEDKGFPTKETAIGAGAGAALGAIVGGKKGAAIGAAAGGAGGAAMGAARKDYEVAVGAGTAFVVRLQEPVSL